MRSSTARWSFLTALLSIGSLAHAGVRVVATSGTPPYSTIQDAVNAASDGDLVLVHSGNYAGFVIDGKALDVVADGVVNVQGAVQVRNVAATRTVTLTGLKVSGTSSPGFPYVWVHDCAGSIRAHGCVVGGVFFAGTLIVVENCPDAAFERCTTMPGISNPSTRGLYVGGSHVALYDCMLNGGGGLSDGHPTGYGTDGAAACVVTNNSFVFASGSQLRGGNGGVGGMYNGYGGAAIEYVNVAPVVKLLDTSLTAGYAACCGPVVGGTPTVLAGVARHSTATALVREAQTSTLSITGQPGDRIDVVLARGTRFRYADAWRGASLVRDPPPQPTLVMQAGTLGPSGASSSSRTLGNIGFGVEFIRYESQISFTDASGQVTLGPPMIQILLDVTF